MVVGVMCTGPDPFAPVLVQKVRCRIACQLSIEVVGAILTLSTINDGHAYVSVPAAVLGICGCWVVLARCMSQKASFSLICATNPIASCCSGVHVYEIINSAATIK